MLIGIIFRNSRWVTTRGRSLRNAFDQERMSCGLKKELNMYKTQLSFASTFFSTTQQAHAMEKYYGKQHSI